MQSTNIRQIKAALRDQAFLGTARVSCPWGSVVAVSRWRGQLRVMIRGWGRWYLVESVSIERLVVAPVAISDESPYEQASSQRRANDGC